MAHYTSAAQAIEILLAGKAFVIKKIGSIKGESEDGSDGVAATAKSIQITWSKHGGASKAWELAKHRAKFV